MSHKAVGTQIGINDPVWEGRYSIHNSHSCFTRPGFILTSLAQMAGQSIAFWVARLAMESLFFTSFFILCYSTVPVVIMSATGGKNGSEKNSLKNNGHEAYYEVNVGHGGQRKEPDIYRVIAMCQTHRPILKDLTIMTTV